MNNDNGNIGIITRERIEENKKLDIGCTPFVVACQNQMNGLDR